MIVRYVGYSTFAAGCSMYYFHRHLDWVNNLIAVTYCMEIVFALLPGLHHLNIFLCLPQLYLVCSSGQYRKRDMQLPGLYLEGEIHSRFHLELYLIFYQGDNSLLLSLLSTDTELGTICPRTPSQCSSQLFEPGPQCGLPELDLEILNIIFIF